MCVCAPLSRVGPSSPPSGALLSLLRVLPRSLFSCFGFYLKPLFPYSHILHTSASGYTEETKGRDALLRDGFLFYVISVRSLFVVSRFPGWSCGSFSAALLFPSPFLRFFLFFSFGVVEVGLCKEAERNKFNELVSVAAASRCLAVGRARRTTVCDQARQAPLPLPVGRGGCGAVDGREG